MVEDRAGECLLDLEFEIKASCLPDNVSTMSSKHVLENEKLSFEFVFLLEIVASLALHALIDAYRNSPHRAHRLHDAIDIPPTQES